ncbi:MAG TPA: DUF288 domain-containing protein [Desulfobulbaceae bacterium]|nr:DUF288 domain-containing protein [Desulfobulbaceae bacterium]
MGKIFTVITTIQKPTSSVEKLLAKLLRYDIQLVVAGDRKGPGSFPGENIYFFSIEDQYRLGLKLAEHLPENHYTRKNIGYLQAVSQGATCIYETDDDNAPLPSWAPRQAEVSAMNVSTLGWINVYRYFTDEHIWPRGFPLDAIAMSLAQLPLRDNVLRTVRAPIQQGLANNSPDVDAVWRLVLDRPFDFADGESIHLPPGAWCPFNSQSTWWWPEAYPLLYLPSYCSFRMTDIWRSFIAQRCLWELGYGMVFHPPEVFQERNPHNLMHDFNEEIPGYQRNRELVQALEEINIPSSKFNTAQALRICYETLVAHDFFPDKEMVLVDAWLHDLDSASKDKATSMKRAD